MNEQLKKDYLELSDIIEVCQKQKLYLLGNKVCIDFVERGGLSDSTISDLLKYNCITEKQSIVLRNDF